MNDPASGAEHAAHGGDPHLAHHFETPTQQFESGSLGMWLFLGTEILLFSGLFCAYAVFRGLHPEVFVRTDEYLDKYLGALNTVILICSSFTMATAVWAAQHSRRKTQVCMLSLTLLGAGGFLGVKFVEYEHKWKHHLLWGTHFVLPEGEAAHPVAASGPASKPGSTPSSMLASKPASAAASQPATQAASAPVTTAAAAGASDHWEYEPAGSGPRGLLRGAPQKEEAEIPHERVLMAQFFAIYFAMTGLHGIHVIAGMIVIIWLLTRAARGHFNASYYTPMHLGGLYWHLVDMIWIYLFPLLYLIH